MRTSPLPAPVAFVVVACFRRRPLSIAKYSGKYHTMNIAHSLSVEFHFLLRFSASGPITAANFSQSVRVARGDNGNYLGR
jgi:hypothetical protein